jgi:menaquinone-dependent protoporphyrinogen oxidase
LHFWLFGPSQAERGGEMIVLVAYASVHGSTRGIAERIAAKIGERASRVELRSLDQIQNVESYDAFVLGSAIHDQAWLPQAVDFVTRHRATLAARPVWLFSVGMPGALGRPLRALAMTEGPKVIAGLRDAITPRDHRLFSGVVVRDQLPLFGHIVFRALGGRYGDFRAWKEIDAWAEEIAKQLSFVSGVDSSHNGRARGD